MTIEIIARGPSRKAPRPDTIHYWLDVAYNGEPLGPNDRIFSLHGPALTNPLVPDDTRVVLAEPDPLRPSAEVLDVDGHSPLYGSTVAWAMVEAIAAFQGADGTILLNGVDCREPSEFRQRESIAFWHGYAVGHNIRVEKVEGSAIRLEWGKYPRKG